MDFNIRPIARNCSVSGRAFQQGDTCWSVLLEQNGVVVRQDISAEHWQGPPAEAIGHWQSRFTTQTEPERSLMNTEALYEYFLQLSDSPNTVQKQYRYVVALLLMRKKRLVLDEVIEIDDQPVMRLSGSGGEGPFDVSEEELSEEEVGQLQQQLFQRPNSAAA